MNLLFGSNWQVTCGRIAAFCLALSATALPITSAAQDFPTKPVRIVVPYSAGGPTDLMARAIAKYMASASGQVFTVENRGGADWDADLGELRGAIGVNRRVCSGCSVVDVYHIGRPLPIRV